MKAIERLRTMAFDTKYENNEASVTDWVFYNGKNFSHGEGVATLVREIALQPTMVKIYVEDLNFHGKYIVDYLVSKDWVYYNYNDIKKVQNGGFHSLITTDGEWFFLIIKVNGKTIRVQSSTKKLPLNVSEIKEGYKTKELENNLEDRAYTVYQAIESLYNLGYLSNTISSDALDDYKNMTGKKEFKKNFPVLPVEIDREIRKSYVGAWTYVHKHEAKKGFSLDINSMYPYILDSMPLPYGEPMINKGTAIKSYSLLDYAVFYEVELLCVLKEGKLPTVRNEMVGESNENWIDVVEGTRVLTEYDKLLLESNYNIVKFEIKTQYVFRARKGMFSDYIKKHSENKIKAKEENNHSLYIISKLLLNSLYGKFGQDIEPVATMPKKVDGNVEYLKTRTTKSESVYVPLASYVTSIGRWLIINAAQLNYDRFLYADTDCIHVEGTLEDLNMGNIIKVHPTRLGAFDLEFEFESAKYLKPKCYFLKGNDSNKLAIAGLPKASRSDIIYEEFKPGLVVKNGITKTQPVKGGCIKRTFDFEIE